MYFMNNLKSSTVVIKYNTLICVKYATLRGILGMRDFTTYFNKVKASK